MKETLLVVYRGLFIGGFTLAVYLYTLGSRTYNLDQKTIFAYFWIGLIVAGIVGMFSYKKGIKSIGTVLMAVLPLLGFIYFFINVIRPIFFPH